MKRVFGVEKFRGLLLASSFAVVANYVVRLSDAVIAGNLIGADALAGVNLAGPVLSVITFTAGLIAIGVGTRYSLAMGACDKTRAHRFFMQGVWSVLLLGGVLAMSILFGREAFLGFLGATGAAAGCARDYLAWIWPVAWLEGFVTLLVTLAYADGDTKLAVTAYGTLFVGNVVSSAVAVKLGHGCAGCAFGSVVAEVLAIGVLAAHFFRRTNSMRFVRHFSLRDTLSICCASFGDAAAQLCESLLFLFINAFALRSFGERILPVVGVVSSLWGLLIVFDGLGSAIQPIVTVYYGERNYKAIRTVMKSAMGLAFWGGALFSLFVVAFPGLVVRLVGITDAALVSQSVVAVRLISVGFVAMAFACVFNSYYMFVEKPFLSGAVTFLGYLVLPVALIATLSLAGPNGLWLGLGLGPACGLVCVAAVICPIAGRSMFPLLLPRDEEEKLHVFNLELTDDEITEVSRRIGSIPGVPMKAALLTEEVFEVVKDRNASRRILGEVTVDLRNRVTLTLRDDGEIFDITDADARISSLRSFLVASMMENHAGKLNLVTTGFNRNVFRF